MADLSQLPQTTGFSPNPLTHPAGVDLTGLPQYPATQIEEIYYQLYTQQGNNQAGNATTSWYQTTQLDNTPQFQLGAIGRFVHPTYGIVMARYVQYLNPDPQAWTGAPVGYNDGPGGFNWQATNDLTQSHLTGLIGLQGAYTPPASGQCGWVITDGINTQSLQFSGQSPPSSGDLLVWSGSGFVAAGTSGVIGRVVSSDQITQISPGYWQIPPAAVHISPSR
jgi:hypothetical protein